MHGRSRAVHDAAIIIDALQISNWGEAVFRNMRRGGLTAVNCTVSVLENFRQTIANIIEWDRVFMALDFPIQNPQGIQNSADFPNLTDALLARGYTESEAGKILGENMVRLFKDVWNA
jgi:microsomal dipeptidase-like Zn-dependent dipeptidase